MTKLWTPTDNSVKKPHPFSAEARAARAEQAALQQPQTAVPEVQNTTPPVSNTEPVAQPTAPVELPDSKPIPDFQTMMMERMDKLEAENAELKAWFIHPNVQGHEVNNDPKQFMYKLRGWIPVVSYVSKKKDPTKDFLYQNQFGQFVEDNHVAELHLANGTTIDVPMNEFWKHHTKSPYMIAKDQNWALIYNETIGMVKSLTFDTTERGTFTILLQHIN